MSPKKIDFEQKGLTYLLDDSVKEEVGSLAKIALEFARLISNDVHNLGGSDDDIRKASANSALRRKLAEFIRVPSLSIVSDFKNTGRWKVIEDVVPSNFKIKDLKVVSFLRNGEKRIDSKLLRERAVSFKANLGLFDAKYILENSHHISLGFSNRYLLFPGTLLCNPGGKLVIPGIFMNMGVWESDFYLIDNIGWTDSCRLISVK